ncbi:Thiosulfate sulfurtransferase GlpE [Neomoorella glycerini]|uniref:Thiosulfate sulfurtransferase GlpE n=1 Tax=Neomoorella glycerini TaxID=55779 RepID=A0A6I5ZN92_9FIRM|nr:rhodanese-like domain-containing protein [Moorella glycerini]QGP91313.1 Thiosulfate sulfurtransferase GlpE [Moorella glycerini]
MPRNNRDRALLAVTVTILVFMVLAAAMGGWPRSGAAAGNNQILQQAVFAYYERMPDHIYKIPEADLKKLVDAGDQSIYILDIREAKDFAAGHIAGAHNIPFKEVGRNLDKLPRDKTIIVYCYTGQTGGQTTAALNIAGFKARSLNGGMNNGWMKAGYPVVK